jgi:hypothetical protein
VEPCVERDGDDADLKDPVRPPRLPKLPLLLRLADRPRVLDTCTTHTGIHGV